MRSTDDPDEQRSPDFVGARRRADSSSVARCSECRLRAGYMLQILSRRACEEREKLQG